MIATSTRMIGGLVHDHGDIWRKENGRTMNLGELAESCRRAQCGDADPMRKDSVSYDMGSDNELLQESIKTTAASLTEKLTVAEQAEAGKLDIIERYMATVHSTQWAFMIPNRREDGTYDSFTTYILNADEWKKFMMDMWTLTRVSGKTVYKLRCCKTENKNRAWMEANLGR